MSDIINPKVFGAAYLAYGAAQVFVKRPSRLLAASGAVVGAMLFANAYGQWRAAGRGEPMRGLARGPARRVEEDDGLYDDEYEEGDESLEDAFRRTDGVTEQKRMRSIDGGIEGRIKEIREYILKGTVDPKIREKAMAVLTRKTGALGERRWKIPEKNWEAEVKAIFDAVRDPNSPISVRYVLDPRGTDTYVSARKTGELRGGDCLPGDTLLLTPNGFTAIADIAVGDSVMGDGGWVKVTKWWDKGILPVAEFALSSGSVLRCTEEHQLFTVPRTPGKGGSRVVGRRGTETEIAAGALDEGDDLLTPESLDMGEGAVELTADEAWLIGVFVADGWATYDKGETRARRFSLSGKDGHPKEEQKRRAERICRDKGWRTDWRERWLDIFPDQEWNEIFVACGRLAHNKHLPHMNVTAQTAEHLLEGLAADASRNTHGGGITYGTTSPELALQIRVLNRMLGLKTSIRRVDDHGGLGKNPIYRIGVTQPTRPDGYRVSPFVSVREARGVVGEEHVFDIEVEGHRFYLPEHDVVVHNCDDQGAIYVGSLFRSVGYPVKMRVVRGTNESTFGHIYTLVGLPPSKPTRWIAADPTENHPFGWEPPDRIVAERRDFDV